MLINADHHNWSVGPFWSFIWKKPKVADHDRVEIENLFFVVLCCNRLKIITGIIPSGINVIVLRVDFCSHLYACELNWTILWYVNKMSVEPLVASNHVFLVTIDPTFHPTVRGSNRDVALQKTAASTIFCNIPFYREKP